MFLKTRSTNDPRGDICDKHEDGLQRIVNISGKRWCDGTSGQTFGPVFSGGKIFAADYFDSCRSFISFANSFSYSSFSILKIPIFLNIFKTAAAEVNACIWSDPSKSGLPLLQISWSKADHLRMFW